MLQRMIESCSNEFDLFADHSVLQAVMKLGEKPRPIPRWRKPKPIHLTKDECRELQREQYHMPDMPSEADEQYKLVGQMFEQQVNELKVKRGTPKLLPCQLGRAQTMQRDYVQPNCATLKPSRQGEPAPAITDWSFCYRRWFTQLRRFVSLQNATRYETPNPKQMQYQLTVWAAIKRATGFPPNFVQWWNQQASGEHWPHLSQVLPSHQIVKQVVQAFQKQVSELEVVLKQQHALKSKLARKTNPNLVFQDVRRPRPIPVQTVVAKVNVTVEEVVDEGSIIVHAEAPLHPNRPFETRSGQLPVVHVEDDQVWFGIPHQLVSGDVIAQVDPKGSLDEVHEAFLVEWMRRWDRHRDMPTDRWHELCELAMQSFHPRRMPMEPITLTRWKQAIRSKKHTAATGMDAISRAELLSMNDTCHQVILHILEQAEHRGIWPSQLLQGAVNSLEKIPGAETVQQFRPITVMPLCYRLWSSIRSRELLKFVVDATSPSMYGKPGSNSVSLWWTLQQRLEAQQYEGTASVGIVSDVVKAFNHLPREPVFAIATALGAHSNLVRAWSAATCKLSRHFFVQGSPSMPAPSCTGFVEGCGLSVASMALVNMLIHRYMECSCPQAVFTSYVDNYELEAESVQMAEDALSKLDDFCNLLDIQLDRKKTYWWANQAPERNELRNQEIIPVRACRDLGGHVQYTGQQGNSTVIERIHALRDLWPKLATSNAPRKQKVRILRAVAWTRGLHGSSITHLGETHHEHLRAQAMKAIGLSKPGANPQIQLSLLETPNADPEYAVLVDSVMQFRRQAAVELVEFVAAQSILLSDRAKRPGPIGVLLTRLQKIGWTYCGQTRFRDSEQQPIDLLQTNHQELKHRLNRCWSFRVGALWAHRKGFAGLHRVSLQLSQPDPKLPCESLGVLRSVMNGTLFTGDFHSHMDETTTRKCALCGAQEDSVFHRHWECPETQNSRDQVGETVKGQLPHLPECTHTRGWIQEPEVMQQFRRALQTIPDTHDCYREVDISEHSVVDLFADGAGKDPSVPAARLVAWGVIIAGQTQQDSAQPLSSGGVPGQWQTVGRAELTAVLSALKFAMLTEKQVRIWCDNEAVIQRAMKIQQGQFHVTNKITDHDLWIQVDEQLRALPNCVLQPIRSHQQYEGAQEWQKWAFRHNDYADREADLALKSLPAQVQDLQQQVVQAINAASQVKQEIHKHFIRVGLHVISQKHQQPEVHDHPVPTNAEEGVNLACVAKHVSFHAPKNLCFAGVHKVWEWMQTLTDVSEPISFVSWYELLADMQLCTGFWGMQSVSTHSTWALMNRGVAYDAAATCRLFSGFVTRVIRTWEPAFRPKHARPTSYRFQCWTMGIYTRLAKATRQRLDLWYAAVLGDQQIHSVGIFQDIMPASLDVTTVRDDRGRGHGLHRFWG